jgi:hypothetical protein
VPFERLVGEVEAVLREVRPHVVVSFGPDGLTSHHDHVRAGEAAAEAFRRARAAEGEPADAFRRLYQAAYPRSDVDRFYAGVRAGGFDYGQEGRLFDVTGVPDERIAVRVDTRPVAGRKWAAILGHRTQLDEHRRIPEPLRWIVLDAECFVQAFPPRPPGEPVAGDLLAGLEARFTGAPLRGSPDPGDRPTGAPLRGSPDPGDRPTGAPLRGSPDPSRGAARTGGA